jgi:hypothetical protein
LAKACSTLGIRSIESNVVKEAAISPYWMTLKITNILRIAFSHHFLPHQILYHLPPVRLGMDWNAIGQVLLIDSTFPFYLKAA